MVVELHQPCEACQELRRWEKKRWIVACVKLLVGVGPVPSKMWCGVAASPVAPPWLPSTAIHCPV